MVGSSTSIETENNPNVATWPRYPPCASGSCTDQLCCAQGTLSLSLSLSLSPSYVFQLYLTYKPHPSEQATSKSYFLAKI
jgi:hypothetical protein